ncbi:orexin/Hypocretin receptor type 1-like [Mercenaria mercenaria]|uniref:orexin/Hypocretin receptor type 1-like n=1 Tax=Mercenaria mercenaria TaxID=6596 RepID=UPI00234F80D9|nr:orexin/Hypocretin receptor type 1-like [Mercenaria mercenaria]
MYSRVKGVYNNNVTLEELNEDLFRLHIPALIFVALCFVTGFVGNLLVLLVYKKKFRRSNHRYFILFLAALDFLACTAGMPFIIASLRLPFLMTSSALCKSMRYLLYVVNNSSGLLLVVISVERYWKICHPFKTQPTTRHTLYLCSGTVFVSAIIAIPAALLYGASTIETGVGDKTGYQCYVDDTSEHKQLFKIYQSVLMIETILSTVIFVILYVFIMRTLWTSNQFIQAMRSMQMSSTRKSDTRLNRVKQTNKFPTLTPAERLAMRKLLESKQQPAETQTQPTPQLMKRTARVTLMLFTVSMVFVIAFVPHLALMIVTAEKEDSLDTLNEIEIMVYQIFLRSFILNNVANPIIYLFCDSKFRKLCKDFIRKYIICNRNRK